MITTTEQVAREVHEMAAEAGIRGCALVDSQTGLIWVSAGEPALESAWEAAINYWQSYKRNEASFGAMGDLGAVALHHHEGVLVILPCCAEPPTLLVAVGEHTRVDWTRWQRMLREMSARVREIVERRVYASPPATRVPSCV